ncbi:hypothetical protein SUGI_0995940 [Cryptomeria japonica]|nr:hypothetical protein SUGI_0995940 [Cryptomeria japonica]
MTPSMVKKTCFNISYWYEKKNEGIRKEKTIQHFSPTAWNLRTKKKPILDSRMRSGMRGNSKQMGLIWSSQQSVEGGLTRSSVSGD